MIRGIHALALAAIVLAAAAVRSTEAYATHYQSLPIVDWVESRPPLLESADFASAADLSRGLLGVLPLLSVRSDARSVLPTFGPPGVVQRSVPGVRDAARIELGSPGQFATDEVPVRARLDVLVFNRALRAAAWSDLMSHAMDVRDPESGLSQVRVSGPEESSRVWVVAPRAGGGIASVVGQRGPLAFMLQVTYARAGATAPGDLLDLSARAETTARAAAADWLAWASIAERG